ncbi:MAG TPA: plastocyanin/azurin family copper-binding protein [Longimicrobiales bacterium]|nr:plastocyanin/azurin family copper-binding protein [Longimicrobiales bacterium]
MRATVLTLATLALLASACGDGGDAPAEGSEPVGSEPTEAAPPTAAGEVIEVRMITDENGNYFEPAEIEAHRGDTLRFLLVSGVHNVAFPDSTNPGKPNMPGSGPMLQLPGQTYDFVVEFPPGEYAFQCDPHALLGMVGVLEVEDEDDD